MMWLNCAAILLALSCTQAFLLDTLFGKNGLARFVLFTRNNARNLEGDMITSPRALRRSSFDVNKPTKFFIHGWFAAGTHWYASDTRKALLKHEDCNVFHVDWWRGSVDASYPDARAKTKVVASELYEFIRLLGRETGLHPSKVHLIGHSLGAQISGEVGRRFKGSEMIGRISGLDPAQPGFNLAVRDETLDPSDAVFVDVIHSTPIASAPMGHVDFYPNNGHTGNWKFLGAIQSHMEAIYMYTESIRNKCQFMAHTCADYSTYRSGKCLDCSGGGCNRMGYFASPQGAQGTLYLTVTNNTPYCDVIPKKRNI